jgi:hypothetical protein
MARRSPPRATLRNVSFDRHVFLFYFEYKHNGNTCIHMKNLLCKSAVVVSGLVFLLASTALAEEKKVNLGVSIPAATHGWTGGVVFLGQPG